MGKGKLHETRAIYLPKEVWERLRDIAVQEERTTSGQARKVLTDFINSYDAQLSTET